MWYDSVHGMHHALVFFCMSAEAMNNTDAFHKFCECNPNVSACENAPFIFEELCLYKYKYIVWSLNSV